MLAAIPSRRIPLPTSSKDVVSDDRLIPFSMITSPSDDSEMMTTKTCMPQAMQETKNLPLPYSQLPYKKTNQSSQASSRTKTMTPSSSSSTSVTFLRKLYEMLEYVHSNDLTYLVSWELDGTAIKIHKSKEFEAKVIPKFFGQTRLKSFQRRLNMAGFHRMTSGKQKGCYVHKFFSRSTASSVQTATALVASSVAATSPTEMNVVSSVSSSSTTSSSTASMGLSSSQRCFTQAAVAPAAPSYLDNMHMFIPTTISVPTLGTTLAEEEEEDEFDRMVIMVTDPFP